MSMSTDESESNSNTSYLQGSSLANLYRCIDKQNVHGLNLAVPEQAQDIIKPWDERDDDAKYAESGVDDQVIIHIPFTQNVRLRSILFKLGRGETTPRHLQIYANHPTIVDFGEVESTKAQLNISLLEGETGVVEYPLRVAAFTSINSLSLFFRDSVGGDVARIYYVGFRGDVREPRRDASEKLEVPAGTGADVAAVDKSGDDGMQLGAVFGAQAGENGVDGGAGRGVAQQIDGLVQPVGLQTRSDGESAVFSHDLALAARPQRRAIARGVAQRLCFELAQKLSAVHRSREPLDEEDGVGDDEVGVPLGSAGERDLRGEGEMVRGRAGAEDEVREAGEAGGRRRVVLGRDEPEPRRERRRAVVNQRMPRRLLIHRVVRNACPRRTQMHAQTLGRRELRRAHELDQRHAGVRQASRGCRGPDSGDMPRDPRGCFCFMDTTTADHPLLAYFDAAAFPWRDPRPRDIHARRAQMADLLLFDILLVSGGIKNVDDLYPPTDKASLQRLLEAIDDSSYDALKKECLVYYLLKWHQDGREARLSADRCIPPQFTLLADAYWHLDSGINISHAVSILSEARLNRDYSSKIIQAISLSPDSSRLILKYIRTAKPPLTEPDDLDAYVLALAENSLLDAWQFQRSLCESGETRPRMLSKILDCCLSPKPKQGPLGQLLAFSFTPYEQDLINAYALSPPSACPPASIPIMHDFVFVHLIQNGQYAAAVIMDHRFAASPLSTRPGVQKAVQERRRMIDEILETLPAVELTLLQAELDILIKGTPSVHPSPIVLPPREHGRVDLDNNPFTLPRQHDAVQQASQFTDLFPSNALRPVLPSPDPPQPPIITPVTSTFGIPPPAGSPFRNKAPFVPKSVPPNASASKMRNAFYDPPKSTSVDLAPVNGHQGHQEVGDDPSAMDTDDEIIHRVSRGRGERPLPPPAVPQLPFSVFSDHNTTPKAPIKTRNTQREVGMDVDDDSELGSRSGMMMMPPGAFIVDDADARDDGRREMATRTGAKKRRGESPPPPPESKRSARSHAHAAVHSSVEPISSTTTKGKQRQSLGRSLPGRFHDDDDDEDELYALDHQEEDGDGENADTVPPLPSASSKKRQHISTSPKARRAASRASLSRGSSVSLVIDEAPVRRSSRISAAHKVPEVIADNNVSAKKPRKSTKGAGSKRKGGAAV